MSKNIYANSVSELGRATLERQVEDSYNDMLKTAFPGIEIAYPYSCDGYFETAVNGRPAKVICEFKYDMNLMSKTERSKILAQVVFYMKRFEADGRVLPNIVLVGDKNECFALHTNYLLKWLDLDVDWTIPPSHAGNVTELLTALVSDESRNAYVWHVDQDFDFDAVKAQIEAFATGVQRKIHITEHNVDRIFKTTFCERILKNAKSIQANDLVALFYGCICRPDEFYVHPTKKNTLVTPLVDENGGAKTFRIDCGNFKAFLSLFDYVKSPSQKARLASISDRLIEDTNRRRKGEFYTPTAFVDKAHAFTSEKLGADWKERTVVWDCACGTKNLTRDYMFKELYCSTLEQAELDISKSYNPGSPAFVFDFLNDPLEKLPEGLKKVLAEKKEITFFINPPYLRANKKDHNGAGVSMINKQMNDEKIGVCSANLFTQFLYRIMLIKKQFGCKVNIAMFCKPIFLTGSDFEKFRQELFNTFDYKGGFLFNAGHFADCSTIWGIDFTVWESKN